jgi:hypothetical protein
MYGRCTATLRFINSVALIFTLIMHLYYDMTYTFIFNIFMSNCSGFSMILSLISPNYLIHKHFRSSKRYITMETLIEI